MLKPIVGEIKAQVLNDNFSYINQKANEIYQDLLSHKADKAKYAIFSKTVNQSIPNNVVTQITFQNKVSSNGEDFCELDQETGRIKILEDGIYEVVAYVTFEPNPNGKRGLIVLNYELSIPTIASQHYIVSSNFAQINAGSLLNVSVSQTSGKSIDLLTNYTQTRVRRVVKI